MPQLEPLNLKLTGSADGLSATLGKAHADVTRFGNGVGGISSRFSGLITPTTLAFGAVVAGAASAAIAIGKIRASMNAIDDVNDAAARLGVTFAELRGLRLSLGEATGLKGEAIDTAIAKLQVNLGEAARDGSGQAAQALAQLGLNAEQLLAAGPQKAIEMLAEKISQVQDRSLQLQLAFDILGRSGVAIAAALRESPDALREAAEWAQKNLSLSEQQVNQVGSANDAWDRAVATIEHVLELIGAELSPLIQLVSEDVVGWAGELGGADDATRGIVETATALYGLFKDIVEVVSTPFRTALAAIDGDIARIGDVWSEAFTFDNVGKSLDRLGEIREKAKSREPRQVSDAQVALLEAKAETVSSEGEALRATRLAADSLKLKADQVKQQIEVIRPTALSAVTDLQAQIRKIAELRGAGERNDALLAQATATNTKLDNLIAAVKETGIEPQPLDLD